MPRREHREHRARWPASAAPTSREAAVGVHRKVWCRPNTRLPDSGTRTESKPTGGWYPPGRLPPGFARWSGTSPQGLLQLLAGSVASRAATSLNASLLSGFAMKVLSYLHMMSPQPAEPSVIPHSRTC